MNLIRNGDFNEWPLGTSFSVASGATTTLVSGDLSYVATGASQPSVTISRQEHPVAASLRQGFPRYFLRAIPGSAPVQGTNDKAYLTYTYSESLDRLVSQGTYGIFTFWAKSSTPREIVVRFQRSFGSGGANANGHTTELFTTQSIQLTTGWRKYQVNVRFPMFPGAVYGAGATVEGRIYLHGGSGELASQNIPWTLASVDISQASLTLKALSETFDTQRLSTPGSASVTTIYVTDPAYGAVGNYSGTQNTAGTGTDNRAAIQAALDAAYTQGPGGYSDTSNGNSYRVVIPKGKYYIGARSDGMPSLNIPLKVELDFSEAELHFERPPVADFGHGITEPNPAWCAILLGPYSGLVVGKMQIVANRDLTYGATWYGLNLDAIRVQESDTSWIRGGGREHYIIGFTRGAAIRYIACLNSFVSDLNINSCAFGIIQSYFGTAFAAYPRYRGTSGPESVCVALWVSHCTFLNIFKKGVYAGVDGDYHIPSGGGFENITLSKIGGGPVTVSDCPFENIAEEVVFCEISGGVFLSNIRIERSGATTTLGTITVSQAQAVKLNGITWQQEGGTCLLASYTGPLTSFTPNPGAFLRANLNDVAPHLENVFISNTANSSCQLVKGDANATRLPVVVNYKAAAATQMQGTDAAYMQNLIIDNDGGRIWSVSTVGLLPQTTDTVNGVRTTFTFLNGFTRQKPQRILVDGQILEATDAAGTNWTWNAGTSNVTFTVAPTKKVRAFF